MMNLETALRVGTPFVTLIFNDGGYGLIEWKQQNQFGEASYVHLAIRFVKADSMGLKATGLNRRLISFPRSKRPWLKMFPA